MFQKIIEYLNQLIHIRLKRLTKHIKFISNSKKNVLIALILGLFVSFIILFIEPYDTNEYKSQNRTILLLGFGLIFTLTYVLYSSLEQIWYMINNKIWKLRDEIISIIAFFALTGTTIYLYNHIVINELTYSLQSHLAYYKNIVLTMLPIIAPPLLFLRYRFGELNKPIPKENITIKGENKYEIIELKREQLLFIKAMENYVEIIYVNNKTEIQSKTFRQTLSKIENEHTFLEKCHRSYLVNLQNIKELTGNSQTARISFKNTTINIPVSKTLYKKIKHKLIDRSINQSTHHNFY